VAIDPATHTADDRKKFDFELIEADLLFPLRFELQVRQDRREELLKGLAIALQGLERGEINLGSRKHRGFGQCRVSEWSVRRYDLSKSSDLIGWLNNDTSNEIKGNNITNLLDVSTTDFDRRESFNLEATFALNGSLLIRSGSGEPNSPDMVHLHSKRRCQSVPILSGTSLAGALRARSLRISKTIGNDEQAVGFVNNLFGRKINSPNVNPTASRLIANETMIENTIDLVQSRIKIDRFTGGSFPTALFCEQPIFGKNNTLIEIQVTIKQPTDAEIGLLLLLLKDLWTGDLPLGGGISVGRGRLEGIIARMNLKRIDANDPVKWIIEMIVNHSIYQAT